MQCHHHNEVRVVEERLRERVVVLGSLKRGGQERQYEGHSWSRGERAPRSKHKGMQTDTADHHLLHTVLRTELMVMPSPACTCFSRNVLVTYFDANSRRRLTMPIVTLVTTSPASHATDPLSTTTSVMRDGRTVWPSTAQCSVSSSICCRKCTRTTQAHTSTHGQTQTHIKVHVESEDVVGSESICARARVGEADTATRRTGCGLFLLSSNPIELDALLVFGPRLDDSTGDNNGDAPVPSRRTLSQT
jgi:hypothetical protein